MQLSEEHLVQNDIKLYFGTLFRCSLLAVRCSEITND